MVEFITFWLAKALVEFLFAIVILVIAFVLIFIAQYLQRGDK